MEWSGRAPAPPASNLARGSKDKEHAMSQNLNSAVAVIGIDIGKNSFHVIGISEDMVAEGLVTSLARPGGNTTKSPSSARTPA
jgi:hypothetical protein